MSSKLSVLQQMADKIVKTTGFNRVLPKLNIIEAANGRCVAEFTVVQADVNLHGGVHGGLAAAVMDNVGSYALMSKDLPPGKPMSWKMMYTSMAPLDAVVIVEANTIKSDETHAHIDCEIRTKAKGTLVAKSWQAKSIASS